MDEILPPGCLRQTAQTSAVDCDCGPPCFKDILSAWGGSALVCLSLEARWTKRESERNSEGEEGRGGLSEGSQGRVQTWERRRNQPGEMCRQRANDDELPRRSQSGESVKCARMCGSSRQRLPAGGIKNVQRTLRKIIYFIHTAAAARVRRAESGTACLTFMCK